MKTKKLVCRPNVDKSFQYIVQFVTYNDVKAVVFVTFREGWNTTRKSVLWHWMFTIIRNGIFSWYWVRLLGNGSIWQTTRALLTTKTTRTICSGPCPGKWKKLYSYSMRLVKSHTGGCSLHAKIFLRKSPCLFPMISSSSPCAAGKTSEYFCIRLLSFAYVFLSVRAQET